MTPEIPGRMAYILPYSSTDKLGSVEPYYTTSAAPSCAIFYSINSTTYNPGLPGLDLGNLLIKTVAKGLQAEVGLKSYRGLPKSTFLFVIHNQNFVQKKFIEKLIKWRHYAVHRVYFNNRN